MSSIVGTLYVVYAVCATSVVAVCTSLEEANRLKAEVCKTEAMESGIDIFVVPVTPNTIFNLDSILLSSKLCTPGLMAAEPLV